MLKKIPILVIVGFVLCAFSGKANAVDILTLKLTDNGESRMLTTTAETVEALLLKEGVSLNEKDEMNYSPADKIRMNMEIKIQRAFDLTVLVDGEARTVIIPPNAKAGNVAAMLKRETGVEYFAECSPAAPVTPHSELSFTSTRVQEFKVSELIDFETEIIETDELEEGAVEVVAEGSMGQKEMVYLVTYTAGEETGRELISETVLSEPEGRVEKHGVGKYVKTEQGALKYSKILSMSATGYSAHYESCGKRPGDPYYGITASGMPVRPGVVAVDPSVIPLGTELYVEGYGVAIAADTGGAIKGMKIDLYFESQSVARGFGRKNLNVYVLG